MTNQNQRVGLKVIHHEPISRRLLYLTLLLLPVSGSTLSNLKNLFKWEDKKSKTVVKKKEENKGNTISVDFHQGEYQKKLLEAYNNDKSCLNENVVYGVDASFPVHRDSLSDSTGLKDRQRFYEEHMEGCKDMYTTYFGEDVCTINEKERMNMNLRQPQSMKNYTEIGFKKLEVPSKVLKSLKQFWDDNLDNEAEEKWPPGNIYTNHWKAPTYIIGIPSTTRKYIADIIQPLVREWVGVDLVLTSLYGIRVYKEDSVLAPHVDRLPLVSSVIINVAQDVDEPWPIEVYGHDGNAYNITMSPGEMIFYESHSVIHGRPFPLQGRYYANVFVHFEPIGHSSQHEESKLDPDVDKVTAKQHFHESINSKINPKKTQGLPAYILPNTPEEKRWRQEHPEGKVISRSRVKPMLDNLNAHLAAASGDMISLNHIAETNPSELFREDDNGWQPIHEAARSGEIKAIKFLVKNGADVNARTNFGKGGSPLWWAKQKYGDNHPSVKLLKSYGAIIEKPT